MNGLLEHIEKNHASFEKGIDYVYVV